ncbi:bifunctional phosphopantothenoylcysteine decarboxylase/phosphopantothenate--cysteine ligase CoaBC [Lapidilactobacillus bayanensis]|uniref:bifunctional phosphopantothenoylcysteine decarboxylase/phosphopantothenate--cysteine ligase CoaBC n=1 Tax=Lapidilactobacillus bayanensis TaxID=2485998 RepID=UPI000F78D35E|nr:bifunctional phosphopantothenoylcysteine decarboxylase/phosphopantothenate--cysteine ligase CoaBC [Lapidilactobacillus bayanensis]
MMFTGKHVLLIITGGIAAYKMPQLVRLFIKQGAQVKVVITENAKNFVTVKTLATVSQDVVYDDHYISENVAELTHLDLPMWADFVVIAPATADIIAKLANGFADNLATTLVLACNKPVYIFPAMNDVMYAQHVTQRNLYSLNESGLTVFSPETGPLAEGYSGKGRLPEPATIIETVYAAFYRYSHPQVLQGKKFIVTAGGTREAIDPVRFIGNRSSGKMGYELARAASLLGANVTLITTQPNFPKGDLKVVTVTTAEQLQAAVEVRYAEVDAVVMAAAPADFRVATPADQKIKKVDGEDELKLTLIKNPDILASLGKKKKQQFLAGFAAETQDLEANAQKKLKHKHLNMIIANNVGGAQGGFDSDENAGKIIFKDGTVKTIAMTSKAEMALTIMTTISERL